jgi:hypothetical protein
MTVLLGSGGSNIATPFPQSVASVYCNYPLASAEWSAPLPANDGSSLVVPTGSPSVAVYSKANVLLYTCLPTSINAAANAIGGIFLDTINGVVWVVALTGTAGVGYLGTFNYTTGVVTAIGSGFTGPTNTIPTESSAVNLVNVRMERSSIGSGNLTMWNGTWNFSISTTTGAIVVAENQLKLNSIGLAAGGSWNYSTLDKTLFAKIAGEASTNICSMTIFRNGRQVSLSFDASGVGGFENNTVSSPIMQWGANQVWLTGQQGIAMYVSASFDQWLQNIATALGMP